MCSKSCLDLGCHVFEERQNNPDDRDPLFDRFQDVKISLDNTERRPLMEVIESKVQYYHNDNRDGFLSFPPSLLPGEIPGFPRETVNNLKDEDEEWAARGLDARTDMCVPPPRAPPPPPPPGSSSAESSSRSASSSVSHPESSESSSQSERASRANAADDDTAGDDDDTAGDATTAVGLAMARANGDHGS